MSSSVRATTSPARRPSRASNSRSVVPLPSDRSPTAGTDESFHLVGLQGLGQCRQPPVRHLGHGRCEIDGNVPTPPKEPEEGTERAHHQLGPTGTNRAQLPQQKARDVGSAHVIHDDGARPKAVHEKAPYEGQAVLQRRLREPPLLDEVLLELAFDPLPLRFVTRSRRSWGNDCRFTQHPKQIAQRRGITPTMSSPEILDNNLLVYVSGQQLPSLQPPIEVHHHAELLSPRGARVPKLLQLPGKRIDVRTERARKREIRHGLLLLRRSRPEGEAKRIMPAYSSEIPRITRPEGLNPA